MSRNAFQVGFKKADGSIQIKGRPPVVGAISTAAKLRISKVTGFATAKVVTNPGTGFDRETLVYGSYNPKTTGYYGPNPGTVFTTVGSAAPGSEVNVSATKNGDIIENKIIYGQVLLGAFTNVIVRNCIIYGSTARGKGIFHISASNNNYRGARIVDCKITQRATYHNEWAGPIFGGGFSIERCEIDNQPDGIGLNKSVYDGTLQILGNYIHNGWYCEWPTSLGSNSGGTNAYVGPTLFDDSHSPYTNLSDFPTGYYPYSVGTANYTHADAIQFFITHDVTIRGNFLGGHHYAGTHNATPSDQDKIRAEDDFYNSCIILKQEGDSTTANKITNVLIENNWFYGGQASLNIAYANGNKFDTVTIQNNRWIRADWSPGYYVLRDTFGGVPIVNVFSNNVFDDDGSAVTVTRGAGFN